MTVLSASELPQRFGQVKLLALDVDGTLTDGSLYYTDSGDELKKFNVKDGQGIKLVMDAGIHVAIISASDSPATLHRAKKLGIPHVYIGVDDKLKTLNELCQKLAIALDQVAYVGDDVNDLPAMEVVGLPCTVADAVEANRQCAVYVTERSGGNGAVREICDRILLSIASGG